MFNKREVHFKSMISLYLFYMVSKNQFLRAPKTFGLAHSPSPSQPSAPLCSTGWSQAQVPRGQEVSAPDLCHRGRQGKLGPTPPFLAMHFCEPLLLPMSSGWSPPSAFQGWERIQPKHVERRLFEASKIVTGIIFWEESWLCRSSDQSWYSQVTWWCSTESQLYSDRKKQPWTPAEHTPRVVRLVRESRAI